MIFFILLTQKSDFAFATLRFSLPGDKIEN